LRVLGPESGVGSREPGVGRFNFRIIPVSLIACNWTEITNKYD